MKPQTVTLFAVVLAALLAFAGWNFRVAREQQTQLAVLRQRAAQLGRESSALRRERDALGRDVAEAERQLAALPQSAATANNSPERQAEMNTWLARVKQLRRLFDEHPEQRIPEMQFLTDQDWLRAAKRVDLAAPDGTRQALALIRDAAAAHFMPQLSSALRKWRDSSPGDQPASIRSLLPFFDAAPAADMLDRYEFVRVTDPGDAPRWRVQTKAPLDAEYDGRHHVDAYVDGRGYGSGTFGAPWGWVPEFREQSQRAYRAYATANGGIAAPSLTEVLPFFNPPLPPALAEKLVKAERDQKR